MKKYLLQIILASMLFAACEQNINIDLGDYEAKVVVYGILQPDSLVKIYLTESMPYLRDVDEETTYSFIKNATVILSDGTITDTLTLDGEWAKGVVDDWGNVHDDSVFTWFYTGNIMIEEGKDYTLSAFSNGREISATTRVPVPVELNTAEFYIAVDTFFGFTDTSERFRGNFTDPLTEGDYYRLSYAFDQWIFNVETVYDSATGGYIEIPLDSFFVHVERRPGFFYNDIGANGSVIEYDEYFYPQGQYSPDLMPDTIEVKVFLDHVSKQLAEFMESYWEQNTSQGDPFSEPVFVRSNITGGLGIFGAFSTSSPLTIYVVYD